MSNNASSVVSKIWAFCNTLHYDGVGYGDYLEQVAYLLFLKVADKYSKPPARSQNLLAQKIQWEKPAGQKRR